MVSQKLALNNDIVLMRHLIRQVKVHIFHKLTKNVKNLRNKKGNEIIKQKSEKKAERLVEELLALKKFDNDLISKDILLEKRTANIILSDINSTIKDRVLAKVMTFSKVSEKIKEIHEKYPESLIIEFVKSNKKRNKKNKKINKSNEKSSEKKEDEGVFNNSKKRKIEIDEETLTVKNEEVVSNKSKKKKLKGEGTEEGVKLKKKEKNSSNKLNRKEKTDIESDENVSGDEIEEKETLTDQNEEVVSNKLKKKKLKGEGTQESVKSKKKDKNISNKLNGKENTDIESDENDNSETLDPFFLMSNEDEKSEIDEEMISNKSKKKKLTKQGKKEIVKSKKKGDEKINSKKKKENIETQNERENVSIDEVKENGESETLESFNTSFNGQHERDDKTISNKSKKKKENEKKQWDKEDVFKDEIKMNKKPKENKQIMEKTVDPFFLMSNGQDEYLSIVQTTSDDSTVKQQNRTYTDNLNRKQRRQLQKNGGKVTKRQFYDKISTNRSSFMNIDTTNNKFSKESSSNKPVNVQKHSIIDEVQNLHPSWQAKLVQKPSVVQFQGKKIVFDET